MTVTRSSPRHGTVFSDRELDQIDTFDTVQRDWLKVRADWFARHPDFYSVWSRSAPKAAAAGPVGGSGSRPEYPNKPVYDLHTRTRTSQR